MSDSGPDFVVGSRAKDLWDGLGRPVCPPRGGMAGHVGCLLPVHILHLLLEVETMSAWSHC